MIELHNLTKRFNDFTAVSRVSLSVARGEILALLGPNGAGKTTTVRMLAAILQPTEGRATVAGYDVTENPREVRRRIGLLTEHPGLYLRMRGGEYLNFFGRLMNLEADEREDRAKRLLERFDMPDAWDIRMGAYSKGMRQKMALARAMLHNPSVLLLDEPTSAMDPHSAKLVRDAILGLRHHRRAIIICTHNLAEAELLADRIAIIRRGKIITRGTVAELKAHLLGPPLMELHLTRPADGVVDLLADLVEVEQTDETHLRYFAPDPLRVNPSVLRMLARRDVEVITLSEVPRRLEEVYLQAVAKPSDEHLLSNAGPLEGEENDHD